MSDAVDLSPDILVDAITPSDDPSIDPDVMVVRGWVGPADDDEHVRINLTEALDDYLEVRADQVVDRVRSTDPLGPSLVWITDLASAMWHPSAERGGELAALDGELVSLVEADAEVAGYAIASGDPSAGLAAGPFTSPTITITGTTVTRTITRTVVTLNR